jgi:hypothetical protein
MAKSSVRAVGGLSSRPSWASYHSFSMNTWYAQGVEPLEAVAV